jgi:hypothetical protein
MKHQLTATTRLDRVGRSVAHDLLRRIVDDITSIHAQRHLRRACELGKNAMKIRPEHWRQNMLTHSFVRTFDVVDLLIDGHVKLTLTAVHDHSTGGIRFDDSLNNKLTLLVDELDMKKVDS